MNQIQTGSLTNDFFIYWVHLNFEQSQKFIAFKEKAIDNRE
ncbi:hypothetical protein [Dapis sp. BLCC M229]